MNDDNMQYTLGRLAAIEDVLAVLVCQVGSAKLAQVIRDLSIEVDQAPMSRFTADTPFANQQILPSHLISGYMSGINRMVASHNDSLS